jgi:hypothetical protein
MDDGEHPRPSDWTLSIQHVWRIVPSSAGLSKPLSQTSPSAANAEDAKSRRVKLQARIMKPSGESGISLRSYSSRQHLSRTIRSSLVASMYTAAWSRVMTECDRGRPR